MAPLRVRVRLRVERGRRGVRDDVEATLLEDDEAPPLAWRAAEEAMPGAFTLELGHVLADVEHLLLQNRVALEGGDVLLVSELRLEGYWLGRVGEALAEHPSPWPHGRAARALGRFLDLLVKQAHEVVDIYQDPRLRRAFAHAIRHPKLLTPRMQRSLLFLVLVSSLWVWLVGFAALALARAEGGVAWNVAFSLYFAALGTNLFVPVPMEPLVLAAAASLGAAMPVAASAAGKAVGAWIIYSLGPALRRAMARLEARSAATRRFMGRAERFARRFGYVALGLLLAIPFSPFDIVPIYLFSTMGLRLGPFLLAVFAGFAVRLLVVLRLGELLADLA